MACFGALIAAAMAALALVEEQALPVSQPLAKIYVVPSEGGVPRRIDPSAAGDYGPAIAPDGVTVAYISQRSGFPAVWLTRLDGAQPPTRLTERFRNASSTVSPIDGSSALGGLAWFPAGDRVAFRRTAGIAVDGEWDRIWQEIWVARIRPRRVGLLRQHTELSPPVVSPNGRSVAFIEHASSWGRPSRVHVVSASGKPIWKRAAGGVTLGAPVAATVWSWDGAFIAYPDVSFRRTTIVAASGRLVSRFRGGGAAWSVNGRLAFVRENDLYVADGRGARPRLLAPRVPLDHLVPDSTTSSLPWSPDGRLLALPDGRIVNVQRRSTTRLPLGMRPLAWAPDSRRLVAARRRALYVARSDGTALRRLARAPARSVVVSASWAHGGGLVVYQTGRGI
jgi:dipeptidyl aminopeptidase/acylaminoacyl peptidase